MATDSFTGSNGTSLQTHDSNWTYVGAGSDSGRIYDNGASLNAWDSSAYRYTGSNGNISQVVALTNSGVATKIEPAVRMQSSGDQGYSINLSITGGIYSNCNIYKDGSWQASAGGSWSLASSHTLRIEAETVGSNVAVFAYVDGVFVASWIDTSSPYTSGLSGIRLGGDGSNNNAFGDDWTDQGPADLTGFGASLLDDFNRSNEGPPPSASWSTLFASDAYFGSISVVSNVARSSITNAYAGAYWNTTYGPHCDVHAKITSKPTDGGYIALLARGSGCTSANTISGYGLKLSTASSGDYFVVMRYNGNGTSTELSPYYYREISNNDSIGLRVNVNVLSVWYKAGTGSWEFLFSVTDSTYTSAGNIGIVSYLYTADIDDFSGGNVTPTTITTVVDPDSGSGYDYDSLSDWESDLGNTTSGDLPAYNEIAIAKCRCTGGTADTETVSIEGWTCDSTHYIKIWTDPTESYRHSGKWETGNKYRMELSTETDNFHVHEDYIKIIGLQLQTTSYEREYARGILISDTGSEPISPTISHCIIKKGDNGEGYCDGICVQSGAHGPVYIYNNIVYDFNETGDNGIMVDNETVSQDCFVYNNTVVNCTTGIITGRYETQDVINNILSGCTTALHGSFRNSYNNATNNASLGASYSAVNSADNQTSKTFTFVGAADFHLQASDTGAKGLGKNLYNDTYFPFQDDIDGDDRGGSGATWDIGADEYTASLVLTQYSFRFRNDDGDEDGATWKAAENVDIYVQ